ncbi:MAG: SDR family oxidoreductase, partial [Gluconacetobacter diazotrophicus]|nr:SDR family oxidoreductase [Gluconacetobacter diazotrophicus]
MPDPKPSNSVVLVTGASSGFGRSAARALAEAGHTVYASMRDLSGRNADTAADYAEWSRSNGLALRTIELDVQSDGSATAAVDRIRAEAGGIDVLVHNAGHMVYGPLEAFEPEQLAQQYDVNVLGTQRLNRAALPHMRERRRGLLLWVGSSSTRGGAPPYLGPYFAAKAGMDALAVCYAAELARWGIETTILVPGSFTTGTNHFANAGRPVDAAVAAEYEAGPTGSIARAALDGLAALSPPDADPQDVARAIVDIVATPFGRRPFRVHVDPARDGAEEVNAVADRMRAELLRNIGL